MTQDRDSRAGLGDDPSSRRLFILATLGLVITGCATEPGADDLAQSGSPDLAGGSGRMEPLVRPSAPPPRATTPTATTVRPPAPVPAPSVPHAKQVTHGVIARSRWASGNPVPSLMNRMTPIRYVTVHHDGMRPFYGSDKSAAAYRLEAIRRGHRGRDWGDIGYHFAIDRGGNIWEGRPLYYQGAHVKNHNEGNVGIVVLGNFERQQPSQQQLDTLRRHVMVLRRAYGVPVRNVRTHREWAATACPGRNLQQYIDSGRSRGVFG